MKNQNSLIKESLKNFRDIVARQNVLRGVAKTLKFEQESSFDLENSGLEERLLDRETIEATNSAVIGGVINVTEENTLKRLLFRSTRG